MDPRMMALEMVPHAIDVRFSFAPYPNADLRSITLHLPEGALLLDAIRQARSEHHVPVYLEHALLSTAQTLIQTSRRTTVDEDTKHINAVVFAKNNADSDQSHGTQNGTLSEQDREQDLQRSMITNYRNYTAQFYTQPDENLFPEAYHTLVHSPIPFLFDAILDLEREYAREVDALLSARDAELNSIQTKHNNALASDTPQRNLTHLMTRHIERMEVAQATWNSQVDDLQSAQRLKYQEFILELYTLYKRRQLQVDHGVQSGDTSNGTALPDGKYMVAEAMQTIGARRSNTDSTPPPEQRSPSGQPRDENNLGSTQPTQQPPSSQSPRAEDVASQSSSQEQTEQSPADTATVAAVVIQEPPPTAGPPPKPPRREEQDVELNKLMKPILEMGFNVEQAKGALIIANRDFEHALNILLEQPDNIPRLLAAKQKVDAMNARRGNRALSSPQQPPSAPAGSQGNTNTNNSPSNPSLSPPQDPRFQPVGRPAERSASVSSPRPLSGSLAPGVGGSGNQKPWSPLPFFQQQRNALLTNNTNPSVKKFGGWLNKAIENLGLDDDDDDDSSRNGGGSYAGQLAPPPASNLDESFTVVLGSSHSRVTHNLRLMVSDPSEVFPSNRVRTERDAAIHAQTASSLYGQNLTGLVQLVNVRDWAKYKGGQVCHQEFFKACQTSTELHFDSIEKQLEALEDEFPLDGSTLQEGDFIMTRHSNLPMIHVVFHLFYGPSTPPKHDHSDSSTTSPSSTSTPTPTSSSTHQLPMFSQSNDFIPKPGFLTGLRNVIRTAHRYEITMLSIPFLMMPTAFEQQLVAQESNASSSAASGQHHPSSSSSSSSRHHRHSSQYGSPSFSSTSASASATSSPSGSSTSSFSTSATAGNGAMQQMHMQQGGGGGPVYYITDQTRRDLQRRSESLLRNLKSFLMDNARQVKQVGNQGSEAEKFRASQGGDVKVVQFLLPKGTSDDMFRSFRVLLVNIFGGA